MGLWFFFIALLLHFLVGKVTAKKEGSVVYAIHERSASNFSGLKSALNLVVGMNEQKIFNANEDVDLYFTTSPKQREAIKKLNNEIYVSNLGFSECLGASPSKQLKCRQSFVSSTCDATLEELQIEFPSFRLDVDFQCKRATEFMKSEKQPKEKEYFVYSAKNTPANIPNEKVLDFISSCGNNNNNNKIAKKTLANKVLQIRDPTTISTITHSLLLLVTIPADEHPATHNNKESIWMAYSYLPNSDKHSPAVRKRVRAIGSNGRQVPYFISMQSNPNNEEAIDKDGLLFLAKILASTGTFETHTEHLIFNGAINVREYNPCNAFQFQQPTPWLEVPSLHENPTQCSLGFHLIGSLLTCTQLGWTQNNMEDPARKKRAETFDTKYLASKKVCASSRVTSLEMKAKFLRAGVTKTAACSGAVNFFQAKAFCEKAGARLCSYEEALVWEIGSETGCELDSKRIWTSTRCGEEGAYVTVAGKSSGFPMIKPMCVLPDSQMPTASARCCADESNNNPIKCVKDEDTWMDIPTHPCLENQVPTGSLLSCVELKFHYRNKNDIINTGKNEPGGKTCASCLFSRGEVNDQLHAHKFCAQLGARLCTSQELVMGVLPVEGCEMLHSVWTSTACHGNTGNTYLEDGYEIVNLKNQSATCVSIIGKNNSTTDFSIACCGDENGSYCKNNND